MTAKPPNLVIITRRLELGLSDVEVAKKCALSELVEARRDRGRSRNPDWLELAHKAQPRGRRPWRGRL